MPAYFDLRMGSGSIWTDPSRLRIDKRSRFRMWDNSGMVAFATFLALCLFCVGSALSLVLSDNQWARAHSWLVPWLWGFGLLFAALALASARWFRRLFISQEAINQEATKQEVHKSRVGRDLRMAGRDYHEVHIHEAPVSDAVSPTVTLPTMPIEPMKFDGYTSL